MTKLHAHVETASRDCDGPMLRDYVETMNPAEIAESGKAFNDFSDLHFKARMLSNTVSFHAHEATVTINPTGFHYHEATDEGYSARWVRWCEDDCDTEKHSQRDIYAEQMGY